MAASREPDPELVVELEVDREWLKVRQFKQAQYEAAGIEEFAAFRLALDPDLDWHQVVKAAQDGASDRQLTDLYLD